VPLFDQLSEKELNNFMPEYLVPEIEYSANSSLQGRSRSPGIYSIARHSGAADEDEYPWCYLAGTWKAQGKVCYDSAHQLEDSGRP
jgi:hypothetical protein